MLCTHGKTRKAKATHGAFAAPKHPQKEPCTPAAARAGGGMEPQVIQAQSHTPGQRAAQRLRYPAPHRRCCGWGNQRTQFTCAAGQ